MDTGIVRQFVKISDGRIGVIIGNDTSGGVFRGHCDMWFGEIEKNRPVVEQLLVGNDWKIVEAPIGIFPSNKDQE